MEESDKTLYFLNYFWSRNNRDRYFKMKYE